MHLFFSEKRKNVHCNITQLHSFEKKKPHTIKQNVFFTMQSLLCCVYLTETHKNASYIRQSASTRWWRPPFCAVRGLREVKYVCVSASYQRMFSTVLVF